MVGLKTMDRARRMDGLTVEQASRAMGVTNPRWYAYLRGEPMPMWRKERFYNALSKEARALLDAEGFMKTA